MNGVSRFWRAFLYAHPRLRRTAGTASDRAASATSPCSSQNASGTVDRRPFGRAGSGSAGAWLGGCCETAQQRPETLRHVQ